jgi:hypothetical protein
VEEDVEKIQDTGNKRQFLYLLTQAIRFADTKLVNELDSEWRHMRSDSPLFLPEDISMKTYGADEQVTGVSYVLRSTARVINALRNGQLSTALDIVRRYTWERTRRLLLCCVYGCAKEAQKTETCKAVLQELGEPSVQDKK